MKSYQRWNKKLNDEDFEEFCQEMQDDSAELNFEQTPIFNKQCSSIENSVEKFNSNFINSTEEFNLVEYKEPSSSNIDQEDSYLNDLLSICSNNIFYKEMSEESSDSSSENSSDDFSSDSDDDSDAD